MGLHRLLPKSLRVAFLYANSTKIAKNKGLAREDRLEAIYKLEKKWLNGQIPSLDVVTEQNRAVAIGLKDMAKIFVALQSPDDAFRYFDVIGDFFPQLMAGLKGNPSRKGAMDALFESYMIMLLNKGIAYCQKGALEQAAADFDLLNSEINKAVWSDPSNARLKQLYSYCIQESYDAYLYAADTFPEKQQAAYRTCLNQLKLFDQRDPGNDLILDLIKSFT